MKLLACFLLFFTVLSRPSGAQEPGLRALERAALRYGGVDPAEVMRWKSQARWAPLLPKITAGYDEKVGTQINNTIQDSISVSAAGVTIGPAESQLDENEDLNRGVQVRAYWELGDLLFGHNQLAISSEARARTIVRTQVLEDLHQAYFERKRLVLQHGEDPPNTPAARLRLEELEARLDALTGGVFSKIKQGGKNE